MSEINGNHRAFESMQNRAQQAFGEFVSAFLNEAMLSGRYLQPGYKGTVIFSNAANPHGDIILSNANLGEVFDALRRRMASAGLAAPVMHSGAAAAPRQDEGEMAMRLVNMVAAIRRAMMFMEGPGNDVAKALLRKVLLEPANEQQVRDVVAGYLSTMPAFSSSHPADVAMFIKALEAGEVPHFEQPPPVMETPQPGSAAHDKISYPTGGPADSQEVAKLREDAFSRPRVQRGPERYDMPNRVELSHEMPQIGVDVAQEKDRQASCVWNDTKKQWEPKA